VFGERAVTKLEVKLTWDTTMAGTEGREVVDGRSIPIEK
jgi:hypothetical protein